MTGSASNSTQKRRNDGATNDGGDADADNAAAGGAKAKALENLRRDMRNLIRLKTQIIASIRADITRSNDIKTSFIKKQSAMFFQSRALYVIWNTRVIRVC